MSIYSQRLDEITNLSIDCRETIRRILSKMPNRDAETWLAKLKIENGHIVGTYYGDVSSILSYNDFVALYKALGYTIKPQDWMNFACVYQAGVLNCVPSDNYTCNPNTCFSP